MRNFLSFFKDSEKTILDIFCYDEKEVRELSQILKKGFKFYVIYAILIKYNNLNEKEIK